MRRPTGDGLLNFGVFGFGPFERSEVGIGVFPGGEEVPIDGTSFSGVVL
jgi:hypothetical protein